MRAPQWLHVEYTTEHNLVTLKWVWTCDILDADSVYCSDPVTDDDLEAYAARVKQDPNNTVIVVGASHADLVELAEAIINLPNYQQARILDTWMQEGKLWRLPDGELEAFILPRLTPLKGKDESGFLSQIDDVYFSAIEELALKRAASVSQSDIQDIIAGECLRQRERWEQRKQSVSVTR